MRTDAMDIPTMEASVEGILQEEAPQHITSDTASENMIDGSWEYELKKTCRKLEEKISQDVGMVKTLVGDLQSSQTGFQT